MSTDDKLMYGGCGRHLITIGGLRCTSRDRSIDQIAETTCYLCLHDAAHYAHQALTEASHRLGALGARFVFEDGTWLLWNSDDSETEFQGKVRVVYNTEHRTWHWWSLFRVTLPDADYNRIVLQHGGDHPLREVAQGYAVQAMLDACGPSTQRQQPRQA